MQDQCVDGKVALNNDEKFIVALDTENSCSDCGMKNICSSKTIEFDKKQFPILSFEVGQRVKIEYEKVVQTSLIVYMIPILFFFAGIVVSQYVFHIKNEMIQFLAALGATGMAFIFVNYLNKKLSHGNYKVNVKPVKL